METALIQERLARLEKEHRWTMRLALFQFAVLAWVPYLAYSMHKEIGDARFHILSANKLELTDPRTGKLRAELAYSYGPYGTAGITLRDDNGHALALISVAADGTPKLVLGGKEVRSQ